MERRKQMEYRHQEQRRIDGIETLGIEMNTWNRDEQRNGGEQMESKRIDGIETNRQNRDIRNRDEQKEQRRTDEIKRIDGTEIVGMETLAIDILGIQTN